MWLQMICTFVFTYAEGMYSHGAAKSDRHLCISNMIEKAHIINADDEYEIQ